VNAIADRPAIPGNIFLTGATGVVGGRILMEILRYTGSDCHCLVRAKDRMHARTRLAGMLKTYGMPEQEYRTCQKRIHPVLGDIALERFGLDNETYDSLAHTSGLVIHMAADLSLISSYTKLSAVNVEGTDHVIDFCLRGGSLLAYGSTFGVIGDKVYQKDYVFSEDSTDIGQKFPESHYPRTKYEAELRIRRAGAKGLRWVILRLGDILGDSRSGAYPLDGSGTINIYYDIFKTVIETGIAPYFEDRCYIAPVDYAARAALFLALHPDAQGSTFHIVNSEQDCFYRIMNLLVECGYALRIVPCKEYSGLFVKNRVWLRGKIYRSLFTRMIAGLPLLPGRVESARICILQAERLLAPAGIVCAPADYNLLARYLNFCIENAYLPSPANQRPLAEIR